VLHRIDSGDARTGRFERLGHQRPRVGVVVNGEDANAGEIGVFDTPTILPPRARMEETVKNTSMRTPSFRTRTLS